MKSLRLFARNVVPVVAGLSLLLFPEISGITLRIYGALTLYVVAFMLYRIRASLVYCVTHPRTLLTVIAPTVLQLIFGSMLLISGPKNLPILALLIGAYFVLSAIQRYMLMFYHRSSMSLPAFIIRLAAITCTLAAAILALIGAGYASLGILLIIAGCEWFIGLLSSPAVLAAIGRLFSGIRLPKIRLPEIRLPKINLPKRPARSKPVRRSKPVDTYSVPAECIYTDGFMDKSVD